MGGSASGQHGGASPATITPCPASPASMQPVFFTMFAKDTGRAGKAYRSYVESALGEGRREDLSGGGLVRSLGGWTEVRNAKGTLKGDQRILGGTDFVMQVLREAGDTTTSAGSRSKAGGTPPLDNIQIIAIIPQSGIVPD